MLEGEDEGWRSKCLCISVEQLRAMRIIPLLIFSTQKLDLNRMKMFSVIPLIDKPMNCLLNMDNRYYSNVVTLVGYSPLVLIDVNDVKNTYLKKIYSFPSVDDGFLNKAFPRDRK